MTESGPTQDRTTQVLIIGAGFAGAATAWALTQRGVRDVVVLEAEAIPGKHGSGLNAAMARRVIDDPILSALAVESVRHIEDLARDVGQALVERRGGMLVGSDDAMTRLEGCARDIPELAADIQRLDRRGAAASIPALEGMSAEAALATGGCGVIDIHALLSAYLEGARARGARIFFREEVLEIDVEAGHVRGVRTRRGRWRCELLVNAAGFRVNPVAALAGLNPPPMRPTRRHLFVTTPWPGGRPDWPFVWDVTHGLYFRPEGGGLLMCACDETTWPAQPPPVDPGVRERLAETFSRHMPRLQSVRPARCWAGLRVLTPDGRFVIGPDPLRQGLFWVAGLGGHGMTTSAGVGHVAAEGILEGRVPEPWASAFAPGRHA